MPGLEDDVDEFLTPVIRVLSASLKATIEGYLVRAYITGDKELVFWGMTKGGIPISYEGPPIESAIKWARDHCAQLVTKMDDETKSRLAQVIADGIENKRGIPGLARDIRNEFENMTKFRSQMIARTETRNALWKGSRERMDAMGVDGKQWYLGSGGSQGNCDECIANADVGIIPIDEEFPNPEDGIHPNCTCAIAPARLARRGEED
ncbi:MAG: phage head morphogenesis protein [Dehalococcoidia bacterium]|nr:phage head morphogenesis protein [Dehalococcoidia bacterium]